MARRLVFLVALVLAALVAASAEVAPIEIEQIMRNIIGSTPEKGEAYVSTMEHVFSNLFWSISGGCDVRGVARGDRLRCYDLVDAGIVIFVLVVGVFVYAAGIFSGVTCLVYIVGRNKRAANKAS
jgi:hypothetical protein